MTIKAIETEYNGYKFRSRLEARWAVFFDAMGIKYEYEPEGYEYWEQEDGTPYRWLPDFRLPEENNLLVEIKGGDDKLKKDWNRIVTAVDWDSTPAGDGLIILGDIPNPNNVTWGSIPIFSYLECRKGVICDYAAFIEPRWKGDEKTIRRADRIEEYVYSVYIDSLSETDFTDCWNGMPKCVSTRERFTNNAVLYSSNYVRLKTAYAIARQARFEYGETPKVKSVFDDES